MLRLVPCLVVAAAAPAMAMLPPGDDRPACAPAGSTAECRLALENPGFDDEGALLSWTVNPLKPNAVRRVDEADPKLAFAPGGSVFQIVPLPEVAGTGKADAYYLPALRAASSQGEGRLRLRLQLIDGASTRTVFSQEYAVGEAWGRLSGGFDLVGASPSAALAVHISRVDNDASSRVLVDDVEIVRQR